MEVKFYRHDSYLEMRRKFTGAWANLRLELHRQSLRFWKEGDDEFENKAQFFPTETTKNELLFTLTGGTTKAVARRLFSDYYSYHGKPGDWIEASIAGNFAVEISYPPEFDTLDECNNPFVLPLNKYIYADFKRRFSERWTKLNIEVLSSEIANDELNELSGDFEMKNFTRVNHLLMNDFYERDGVRDVVEKFANEAVLRDEVYLSALADSLERSNVFFRIKNEKLGIYWERNLKYHKLKDFQEAEFLKVENGD